MALEYSHTIQPATFVKTLIEMLDMLVINNDHPAEAQILSSQPFLLSFSKYDRSRLISSYRRVSALCTVHHAVAELLFSFLSSSNIASSQTSHILRIISRTIPSYPTPSPIPSSPPESQPMTVRSTSKRISVPLNKRIRAN